MSAWIVSKNHIDTLVWWAFETRMGEARGLAQAMGLRDEVGQILWAENLRSVAYRYPDDVSGNRPGPNGFTDDQVKTYVWRPPRARPGQEPYYAPFDPFDPNHALRQVECYDYQTCENYDYRQTPSGLLMTQLHHDLSVIAPPLTEADSNRIPWGPE